MSQPTDDHDSPWKEALGLYFRDFVELLFPEIDQQIDWDREVVFLDAELQKLVSESKTGRRTADKLAKVYTRQGSELWVVMHVEIQGYSQAEFAARLLLMNCRLYDHHQVDVVSVAVLTDNNPSFTPSSYSRGKWGCRVDFEFPIQKLLTWQDRWEELENSRNRFALVVMAQLKALATKQDRNERKNWKTRLIRSMYQRNYQRTDIEQLFRVIDWLLRLPRELEQKFLNEHYEFEEQKSMTYITSAERFGIEKGERALLERLIAKKFGPLDAVTLAKLAAADSSQLVQWGERILTAEQLEDLFKN